MVEKGLLFHEVSEKEKEEIQKQAKGIMDSFYAKLEKVDLKVSEQDIKRGQGFREEGSGKIDESFSKEVMFENAPNKNKDFIVAEKKSWGSE
jgi:Asp-tRNA(Asn)/Glu-tRNA(Gln) amidotransferase C subunit